MHKDPSVAQKYAELVESVNSWPTETCNECGNEFPKEKSFSSRCPICFKVGKDYAILQGDKSFLWMQMRYAEALSKNKELMSAASKLLATVKAQEAEIAELKKKGGSSLTLSETDLDMKTIRDMLVLCHPDRHSGTGDSGQSQSDKAHAVTQKLLILREKLRS